jgi:glycosyltransferase involved in cell wall biosynthesis
MRIVIDMQGAQTESRFRGIGRYTSSLVKAIIKNRGDHEVIVVLSSLFPESIQPIRDSLHKLLPQKNIVTWSAPGPTFEADPRNKLRKNCAEILYEDFLSLLNPDVILITSLFEGLGDDAVTSVGKLRLPIPTICIIYDLIPLVTPDEHFRNSYIHKEFYKNKLISLKNCSCLLAISESTRQEALISLGIAHDDVINISGASDLLGCEYTPNKARTSNLMLKFGITQPYIMYTGGADDRKNLHRLIQAFSIIPSMLLSEYQLILVGKMPVTYIESFKHTVKKSGIPDNKIIFTGFVSDEDLVELYANCKSFVFPSLHEGFGLPPLEAMNYGVPVIASNVTSLPEVIGNPDALFDPLSIESISQKIIQSLVDDSFRKSLITHAAAQVKLFSWDKSAKAAILAMEQVSKKWHTKNKSKKNLINLNRVKVIDALIETELSGCADDGYVRSLSNSMALNEPRIGKIQLLLDVSTIVHSDARSGIQRVVRSLLHDLLSNPPLGYEVRPIFLDGLIYRYAPVSEFGLQARINLKEQPPISYWAGDVYLALDLNMHLVSDMHYLHERMRARGVSLNFIVYDLLLISNPQWWLPPNPQLFLDWLKSICMVADNLICISDTVRQELLLWLKENKSFQITGLPNLKYFHLGANVEKSQPSLGLPDNFKWTLNEIQEAISFVMVGTVEPRKGHKQVIEAFELIWRDDLSSKLLLVIVGKAGWLVDSLTDKIKSHKEFGRRLFWLEEVSDEYIEKIYATSSCMIAASHGEGFGLPLIEAAQNKLPIICRDIPVFREVAGENAFYFDSTKPEQLAQTLRQWLELYKNDRHPSSVDMHWLTWKQSASQLLKAIGVQSSQLLNH